MLKFTFRFKGGPGSGHRGHAGRPGQVGGSIPGGGDLARSIVQVIGDLKAYTVKAKREKIFVLDNDGNVQWDSGDLGEAHAIGELVLDARSRVLVHNHLGNTTFSESDIATFLENAQVERSIVWSRMGVVYEIGKRSDTPSDFDRLKLTSSSRKWYAAANDQYEDAWLDGKLSDRQYKFRVGIGYMEKVAKAYNFDFSYELDDAAIINKQLEPNR